MQRFIKLYATAMPFITFFSTAVGLNTGFIANERKNPDRKPFETYGNIIGYTSLGVMTGITYPLSYPLFGVYVLYK